MPLVRMNHISKSYPGVLALDNVSFTLERGEIHSLCGENGAGKSTLIKILTGAEERDGGEILLDGAPISPKTPMDAQKIGISTVYQEVNLCPNLSVAENVFIGRQPRRKYGGVDWKEMNRLAEISIARLNLKINVMDTLDEYSVAMQQMVAIARAVDVNARVLVLDEPTSSLDRKEVTQLFSVMRGLREKGMGIIFISHFIDQVYEISDRITILRNGQYVDSQKKDDLPRMSLISKMIGKEYVVSEKKAREKSGQPRDVLYSARNLGKKGTIEPADIDIYSGEVLGFAGLLGCGRTETARLIFGIERPDNARVSIKGKNVRINTPQDGLRNNMGFCPEDRKRDGVIADLTIRENIALALQARYGMFKLITRKQQDELARKFIETLAVVTPGPEQLVKNLSGGNQQKVVLARWLATQPDLLILDEPTRGIDVGAKSEIMNFVVKLAEEGKSIVFISSELDEVVRCSNRALIYRDRRKVGELSSDDLNLTNIMEIIAYSGEPAREGSEGAHA
jgi:simple sugar transport system ATP-binding protein